MDGGRSGPLRRGPLDSPHGLRPVPWKRLLGPVGAQQQHVRCVARAVRIQGLAGPDALLVPRVQGGYDPRSRIVMAPWGNQEPLRSRVGAWEGAVAEPPSTLFETPIPVLLVAEPGAGGDVRVDQRGSLTATPAYLLTKNSGEGLPGRLLPSDKPDRKSTRLNSSH